MEYKYFYPANVLLPKEKIEKWAVIACDQYTSEPEYWKEVEEIVGSDSSALRIVLPEAYLGSNDGERIRKINETMSKYINEDVFCEYPDTYVYLERQQSDGKIRHGIVGCIDLADYDYNKGSDALIRATEETVLSRVQARVKIRKDAPLELTHVMLLVDDEENLLFSDLKERKEKFQELYDFDLMQKGGHIKGWKIDDTAAEKMQNRLNELCKTADGLLFCSGDGNHSLATAKQCYENNPNEYNRYALVEIVNIHDEALEFEPIYRLVFNTDEQMVIEKFLHFCGGEYQGDDAQRFTCVTAKGEREISVKPLAELSVATLQKFLDAYLTEDKEAQVDYIHGVDSLKKLSVKEGSVGFLFEGMQKSELFTAVKADGSLPRKTFSMGMADDKRFYLEARKIK